VLVFDGLRKFGVGSPCHDSHSLSMADMSPLFAHGWMMNR
jgi:hypothetical protein